MSFGGTLLTHDYMLLVDESSAIYISSYSDALRDTTCVNIISHVLVFIVILEIREVLV